MGEGECILDNCLEIMIVVFICSVNFSKSLLNGDFMLWNELLLVSLLATIIFIKLATKLTPKMANSTKVGFWNMRTRHRGFWIFSIQLMI